MTTANVDTPQLGLRANVAQFSLLVVVNAFVGAMVGMERTILPAIGRLLLGVMARETSRFNVEVLDARRARERRRRRGSARVDAGRIDLRTGRVTPSPTK